MYKLLISIALVVCVCISATQSQGTIDIPQGNEMMMRVAGNGTYEYICENSAYRINEGTGRGDLSDNFRNMLGTFSINRDPNSSQITVTFTVDGQPITFNQEASQPSTDVNSLPSARYSIPVSPSSGLFQGSTFVQHVEIKIDTVPNPTCNNGESTQVVFRSFFDFFKASSPISSTTPPTIPTTPPTTTTTPPTIPTNNIPESTYIPQEIALPNFYVEQLRVRAEGHYSYKCQEGLWKPNNLFGELFQIDNASIKVGDLSVSAIPDPNGEAQIVLKVQGSEATLKLVSAAASESYMSVSRALFESTATTPGSLEKVRYVQRLSTVGGVMSKEPCRTPNADITVPFSAVFAFFVSS